MLNLLVKHSYFIKTIHLTAVQQDIPIYHQKNRTAFNSLANDAEFLNRNVHSFLVYAFINIYDYLFILN